MLAKIRSRLTYANVVSTICLFLVVGGGGAYAANTVFSTDIVDGEVKTPDLADGGVTRSKLASSSVINGKINNSAVTGDKVADNSLTGADLDESTLGKVGDANTLDGKDWLDFVASGSISAREKILAVGAEDQFWFSVFGAQIWVGCNATLTEVKYKAAVNNLVVWRDNGGGDAEVFKPAVGNFIPDAVNGNADTQGEMLTFMSNTGHIVFITALRNTGPNPDECHYRAIAMQR